MDMVTIGDLLLDKQFRMRIKSSIIFVRGGMLRVSVGLMVKTMVVIIVIGITPRVNYVNLTRSSTNLI